MISFETIINLNNIINDDSLRGGRGRANDNGFSRFAASVASTAFG